MSNLTLKLKGFLVTSTSSNLFILAGHWSPEKQLKSVYHRKATQTLSFQDRFYTIFCLRFFPNKLYFPCNIDWDLQSLWNSPCLESCSFYKRFSNYFSEESFLAHRLHWKCCYTLATWEWLINHCRSVVQRRPPLKPSIGHCWLMMVVQLLHYLSTQCTIGSC